MYGIAGLTQMGFVTPNEYGKFRKKNFSKVKQTPEAKQAVLAKAERKRERKRTKRFANYKRCLFSSSIIWKNGLHHWQISERTASPAL